MFKALKYFLLALFLVVMVSCSHDNPPLPPVPPVPPPPPPPPVTSFQVSGTSITVKGQTKAGTKVTVREAKAAVGAAVKQLEAK